MEYAIVGFVVVLGIVGQIYGPRLLRTYKEFVENFPEVRD